MESIKETTQHIHDRAQELTGKKPKSTTDKVFDMAENAKESAAQSKDETSESAKGTMDNMRSGAQHLGDRVQELTGMKEKSSVDKAFDMAEKAKAETAANERARAAQDGA